ncbi:[FeFe] hydrogenase, group A [Patescibacteria group bacterium]|nr:[FeFe] hydrogenase, group A [Patescibacteria group bacterium]
MKIIINNKKIEAKKGQTILEVAQKNKIDIPSLCFHSDLDIKSNCRLCVVEIKGKDGLHTACSTMIEQGMKIITESKKIHKARKINLELIFAQHCEECNDCIWNFNCQLLKLAKKYNVEITRFTDRKKGYPVHQFGPSLIFDSSKCIDCRNCIDVCQKQGVGFLEIKERGHLFQVIPSQDKNKDCIYCGQCITHCPVGAFEAVGEFEDVEKPLQDKSKTVIFQFAPAIRTSIGEEFNLPHGSIVTEQLVAGIKKLGVDKVFDVSVAADFATVEEAKELIERLETNKNLPMFTSCCPSWVKFVEFYYPEFIPHLTSVRSPQIILGGLIKTFWAEKENIDPEKITVVSVMPCVAKKYEIQREELNMDGLKPVDYVLTTRELAYLFTKHKIDLKNITPKKPDNPLGVPSGAGVIYGASGGVMESALRTAYEKITGQNLKKLEFQQVRGMDGIKKATVEFHPVKCEAIFAKQKLFHRVKGLLIKTAVVNGIGNAKKILEELKENPKAYDFVEVMACFGGCIGGGGQPVPTDSKIRKQRAKSLYQIDAGKKIRSAHENPVIKKVYENFLNSKKKIHSICHTKHLNI